MNDLQERVANCFRSVFPGLPAGELPRAGMSSLAAWDSIAQVTLLSALAEEFQLDFELEDFEQLSSYPLIVDYLENKFRSG